MQIKNPDAAGIDIGSREHWVAVPADSDTKPVRHFESFTSSLRALADWLEQCGVTTIAMESTGVYWVPLYELLDDRGFDVCLVNAHHVKNVPGRKSDVLDCQWLQQLHSYGLLSPSFRPDAEIVALRSYVRQRESLVCDASRMVQHMQKALSQMNVQLHTVIADLSGMTGLKIVRSIVAGERDPRVLAQHRDYRCRASEQRIIESLRGNYRAEHVFALEQALTLYDAFMKQLRLCEEQIEATLKALAAQQPKPQEPLPTDKNRQKPKGEQPLIDIRTPLHQLTGVDLTQIDAIAPLTALSLVSEIGTDMSHWRSSKHFTSWLNLAPGTKITGGKSLSGRRRFAPHRAANLLRMAAMNIGRTDKWLGSFYRRKAAQRGKGIAIVATARKLAVIIYNMLKYGSPYRNLTADDFARKHAHRDLKYLQKRAKSLGFELVKFTPEESPTMSC